jgi:hypothetical protein
MPTYDTPRPISVAIDIPVGDVRIVGAERADTVVEVRPRDESDGQDARAVEQTTVAFADDRLTVRGPRGHAFRGFMRGGAVEVTIELPAGSHVEGTIGVGAFTCEGRLGDCRLRTGVGDVRVDRAGTVELKTGTGDVTVDLATGHAEVATGTGHVRLRELDHSGVVKNATGDIWVGRVAGDLRVKVASGSIAVDHAETNVGAKTATGDVRLGDVAHGSVVLETHAGDLEVGIREGTAAWLDVRSTAGRVLNGLEATGEPDPGSPSVQVRARTTVGDVAIRRA